MEKKKWLWKRKSSERSPGDSESSGSLTSYSERYCDDQVDTYPCPYSKRQDPLRESPSNISESPEVTSSALIGQEELKETMNILTEKLAAALVNVGAKEELVKQHVKVAEEAIAGWEKAETEVSMLKQQLEAAVQQNLNLESRISHLDGALKECVRQLRQARDEQENRISDAVMEKKREWEYNKTELEKQILELQVQVVAAKNAFVDPKSALMIETLEKENSFLKLELASRFKELEIMIFERDLSTQAAETASKLQLEAIKKVVKLEAECRRLLFNRKSSPSNNQKTSAASYLYADSLTDSHSDSGDRLNSVDTDTLRSVNVEPNGSEPNCADSWASALIAELDQFKNEKLLPKGASRSVEIEMMDDFLEMERLVALPDTKSNTPFSSSESPRGESISMENPSRAEFDSMVLKVAELEKKLEKVEAEKMELEAALAEIKDSLEVSDSKIAEAQGKLEELQKMLAAAKEAKEFLELQLIGTEAETRTMSANVHSLKTEIEQERSLSAELTNKCQVLEIELALAVQQKAISDSEPKVKQVDLAVAADKLAECQKTIASLGRQLESLATLEDFLLDTSNIPGFSCGPFISNRNMITNNSQASKTSRDDDSHLENGISVESLSLSSLSASSVNHITSAKSRNGFGKFFTRSKSGIEVNTCQE